jgi:DNA-binding NarL/FixJ family response regulator
VIVATHGGIDLSSPALQPGQALLMVTGDAEEVQALAGLELAAWGVISPEATAEALQAAVRGLAEGLAVLSPEILRQALEAANSPALAAGPLGAEDELPGESLTEREKDVLLRLAQGLTNKQIALALGISEHTVKFHVSSIYTKLGVSNRTEAVRKGARRGWVPL